MKPFFLVRLVFALACGVFAPAFANAGVIYYSGNSNSVDALANVNNGAFGTSAIVYNSFTVSGSGVVVTGLFTNNFMDYTATTADWSIRSGVSNGNGGTVVAFGTGAATQTATGNTLFDYYQESTIAVSVPNVFLAAGNYWFNVTPVGLGGFEGFAAQSTANGVTNPYFSDDGLSIFFDPATSQVGGPFTNFSGGVNGNLVVDTPEPTSIVLMATGAAIGAWFGRGRLRRKTA